MKYECALKKLVKSQSGHMEKPFADHWWSFPYDHSVIWRVFKFCKGIWVGTSRLSLSGGFWAGQAQTKVVKMKKKILPTGLQVHLEDMFWV